MRPDLAPLPSDGDRRVGALRARIGGRGRDGFWSCSRGSAGITIVRGCRSGRWQFAMPCIAGRSRQALGPERKRRVGRPAPAPALSAYHGLIDEWLVADQSAAAQAAAYRQNARTSRQWS